VHGEIVPSGVASTADGFPLRSRMCRSSRATLDPVTRTRSRMSDSHRNGCHFASVNGGVDQIV
jgi:hypothetical protein